jgi:hypothetical protein
VPPRLTKPTNVPAQREPLVDMLWRFFIAANRPTLKRVAEAIEALDDEQRVGTANPETIRRNLRGQTVGQLETIQVIFLALCRLADVDPHDMEGADGDRWNPPVSHMDDLRRRWHEAFDEAPMPDLPRTRAQQAAELAAAEAEAAASVRGRASSPYGDEAPF